MNTTVTRIPLVDAKPLERRIEDLCDVQLAAGFKLAAMTVIVDELLLVFQKYE